MAELKMESTSGGRGDVYAETIDYIRQIEKEIVFALDDGHVELDDCITSKDINAYCDILLDKISQELYITSSFEKDALNSDLYLNKTHSHNNIDSIQRQHLPTTFAEANSNHKSSLPKNDKDS